MNTIIEVIGSLAQSYIVVRFCNKFLGYKEKYGWIAAIMFYALIALDNIYLSQREGYEYLSVAILLAATFVYCMLFLKGKIYEKLFVTFVPMLTMLPINLISVLALSAFGTGDPRPLLLFTCNFAFFIVCEALVKIKKGKEYSLSSRQWMIQLLCFVISVLIAGTLWKISVNSSENKQEFLFIYLLIAVLNVLLYIIMNKMQRDNEIREEYDLLKANISSQEKLAIETKERYSEVKKLKHDMKHYLTAAAGLISDGRPDSAKDYIEKILNEKVDLYNAAVNTGNAVIDAVINNKIALCNSKGINLKCAIDTHFDNTNDIDISILLSNLLDNAVEGCDLSKPYMELIIGHKKSMTYIAVKNSISKSVLSNNPGLKTDKPDKKEHGYGIRSIKDIAKKHDGSVDFTEKDGRFIVEVWLKTDK